MKGNLLTKQTEAPKRTNSMVPPGMGELNYLQSLIATILDQELNTTASPTFVGATFTGLTASLPIVTNASKALASVSYATFKASLAIAQADVTGLKTTDSPSHVGLTLSGLTASIPVVTNASKALASVTYAAFKSSLAIAQADVAGLTITDSPTFGGLTLTGLSGILKAATGVAGTVTIGAGLSFDGTTLTNTSTGSVTSVFTRTGAVVAATNDYTWAQIDKTTSSIADIATRSHTSLTDIGTLTHATIDGYLDQSVKVAASPTFAAIKLTTGAGLGKILTSDADGDATWEAFTALTNPMDDAGQLIYGGVDGAPTKLAAGATTTILVGGGAAAPVWTTATGTGAPVRAGSPTFTTQISIDGTILLKGAANKIGFANDATNYYLGPVDVTNGVLGHSFYGWTLRGNTGVGLYVGGTSLVGINTLSPSYGLDARSSVGFFNSGIDGTLGDAIFIGSSSYPTTYRNKIQSSISATAANSKLVFSLSTGSAAFADVLTLLGNGYVGIGTTAPGHLLHLGPYNSNISIGNLSFFCGMTSGADTVIGHNVYADQSSRLLKQSVTGYYGTWIRLYYDKGIAFGTSTAAGTAGDTLCNPNGTTNEKVFITNAGSVGIGTTAPTTLLNISSGASPSKAQFKIVASDGCFSVLNYSADNVSVGFDVDYASGWMARDTSACIVYKGGAYPDHFTISGNTGLTSGNEFTPIIRFFISLANGNVGINVAPDPISSFRVVLPVYASHAAAVAAGLTVGAFFLLPGQFDVCVRI